MNNVRATGAGMSAHRPECVCMRCEDGREWLAAQGLHVVTAADQAVLDAAARMRFSNDGCDCIEIDDDGGLPEAELARREALRAG